MDKVVVGLSAWIIQDGNYPDFRVGESARFALEFHAHSLRTTCVREPSAEQIRPGRYSFTGRSVYAVGSAWVIDFGLLAYRGQPAPRAAKESDWLEGDIYLGVDPFFYFEELSALPGMPALQYHFRVRRIWLETTPWVEIKDGRGRRIITRDDKNESFREVAETNAWEDDGGRAHYLLECERIDQKSIKPRE